MSDPADDANIVFLANWDGNNGDAFYTSEIGADATFNGDAQLSNAITLFGNTTVRLPGSVNDSHLVWGTQPDLQFLSDRTVSWTIELWFRPDIDWGGDIINLIDTYGALGSGSNGIAIQTILNDLYFSMYGSSSPTNAYLGSRTPLEEVMTYFKFVYLQPTNQLKCYTAGTLVRTINPNALDGGAVDDNMPLYIGRSAGAVESWSQGYLGPIRITKNEALDDTDVPTGPFPFAGANAGLLEVDGLLTSKPVNFVGYQDISALLASARRKYSLVITGDPELTIPISTWQATVQDVEANYAQCSIPNAADYVTELSNRLGVSDFIIYGVSNFDGQEYRTALASAPLGPFNIYRGPYRYTVTVSGYTTPLTGAGGATRVANNVRLVTISGNNLLRVRCDIDWFLRPGDTLQAAGYEFVVSYINYYVPAGQDHYMDVGER